MVLHARPCRMFAQVSFVSDFLGDADLIELTGFYLTSLTVRPCCLRWLSAGVCAWCEQPLCWAPCRSPLHMHHTLYTPPPPAMRHDRRRWSTWLLRTQSPSYGVGPASGRTPRWVPGNLYTQRRMSFTTQKVTGGGGTHATSPISMVKMGKWGEGRVHRYYKWKKRKYGDGERGYAYHLVSINAKKVLLEHQVSAIEWVSVWMICGCTFPLSAQVHCLTCVRQLCTACDEALHGAASAAVPLCTSAEGLDLQPGAQGHRRWRRRATRKGSKV
jgi:hypothetical protein